MRKFRMSNMNMNITITIRMMMSSSIDAQMGLFMSFPLDLAIDREIPKSEVSIIWSLD